MITPYAYPMDCTSIAYEPAEPGSSIYGLYLKNAAGERYILKELSDQLNEGGNSFKIYYLYYPKMTIHYMVEDASGNLSYVQGSTDGVSTNNTITYNGESLTMNGIQVSQMQSVEMPPAGITVSQEVGFDELGNAIFNIPPLLDNGTHKLDLVYYQLGVSAQNDYSVPKTNISQFGAANVTETLTLYSRIVNNKLSWMFADGENWFTISDWPVVYAIYRERGYNLTVSKTVTENTGYDEPFTVTIRSAAINRSTYKVEGTGYTSINAIPAQLDNNTLGQITFPVEDGDSVTIVGLAPGEYTVTETGNDNFVLTATKRVGDGETTDVVVLDNIAEKHPGVYLPGRD